VKVVVDSMSDGAIKMVIKDSLEYGLRLHIYKLSEEIVIKEGTWIIIKEPYLKFG